ncbi:hypothetical protein PIB30_017077 [Stylosanthes scabra]|uniref:Uncharacterized protein n=1 Tax=Stylosanthes scabra TaxID=79078 RepID=A0ABU6T7S4_9FABA|nr:hypothetical protein [Stylosanthes scabra]
MAGRNRGRGQAVRDPDINRLNATHHVAGVLGFEGCRFRGPVRDVIWLRGGDRKHTVSISRGASGRSRCSVSPRPPNGWRPDWWVREGFRVVVRCGILADGSGFSWQKTLGGRREELCRGEDVLAEAACPRDPA